MVRPRIKTRDLLTKLRVALLTGALLTAHSVFARDLAVFFGGGEETPTQATSDPSTIFLDSLTKFNDFAEQKHWETIYRHDGSHAQDQAELGRVSQGKGQPFTKATFQKTLADLKVKLEGRDPQDQLKSGDKLLLFVSTHGSDDSSGICHEVTTTDGFVDLADLKSIEKLAEEKGVKLAVVDTSCHSGRCINLASSKTCVISTAGFNEGSELDNESLLDQMKTAPDLESAFLSSRKIQLLQFGYSGQPQISTPVGSWLFAKMSWVAEIPLSAQDYVDSLSIHNQASCFPPLPSDGDLSKLRDALDGSLLESVDASSIWEDFVQQVVDYRTKAQKVNREVTVLKSMDKTVCETESWSPSPICSSPSRLDFDVRILEGQIKADPGNKEYYQQVLAVEKKFRSSPEFKKYRIEEERVTTTASVLDDQHDLLGVAERRLYTKVYQGLSDEMKGSNACRDFKL